MKKMIAALVLILALGSNARAAVLPLPAIGSATIYARYNGENVITSGADVTTWQNIQPSAYQATLNATLHTGMGGGVVTGLPDLTTNVSDINGLPYLRFTRTSSTLGDALRTGTLSVGDQSPAANKFTIFHVGRFNSLVGPDPEVYDGVDASHRKAFLIENGTGNRPTLFTTTSGAPAVTQTAETDFHIWATVFDGSNSQLWKDGVLIGSSLNPGTQSPWAGFSIGARHLNFGANGYFANVDIAELMGIGGALNSTDFNTIGSYLEFKYGLSTAFPNVDFSVPPAPEPSTALLLGLGCLALRGRRRR